MVNSVVVVALGMRWVGSGLVSAAARVIPMKAKAA